MIVYYVKQANKVVSLTMLKTTSPFFQVFLCELTRMYNLKIVVKTRQKSHSTKNLNQNIP